MVIKWIGCKRVREGRVTVDLFDPNNDMIMLDDGYLPGWPRIVDGKILSKDIGDFDPKVGLDIFGYTGQRMVGKIILLNFERTRGWQFIEPWITAVQQEIIRRVAEVDPDATVTFYLYDWSDTIDDGTRYADKHIDGRFIPIGDAWGRDSSSPVIWLNRFARSIQQLGDIPMIQPLDTPVDRMEKFMLMSAMLSRHLSIWAVPEEHQYDETLARMRRYEAVWNEMQYELDRIGYWDRG